MNFIKALDPYGKKHLRITTIKFPLPYVIAHLTIYLTGLTKFSNSVDK